MTRSSSTERGAAEAQTITASSGGARWVAAGILVSKVGGLVRETLIARFLGLDALADVWRTALRAPNVLQNMLGEQTLSAAFIPAYSRLLEEGRDEDAARLAGAVLGLLAAVVAVAVAVGVLAAPWIVAVLTPGFLDDERYPLLVSAVRIVFPMTGFLVLSAWALGVLNSHRRFLLPYLAPAVWNAAIIGAQLAAAASSGWLAAPREAPTAVATDWLFAACWGALAGGVLQLVVQLPTVWRLTGGVRPRLPFARGAGGERWLDAVPGLRQVVRTVGPALAGRGVVQLSLYVDTFLASFLAAGAPAAIGYAGTLINLPLGVFAMSVAAAELPELSRRAGDETTRDDPALGEEISTRVGRGLRQAGFVVAPSVVGYLVFGFLVAGLLFRRGNFGAQANWLVWAVVGAYALGLLASTVSRLLQNVFFALRDTVTPARIAAVRVASAALVGVLLMRPLDRLGVGALTGAEALGSPLFFGAVGLALASSVAAWCELGLLTVALRRRLPTLRLPVGALLRHLAVAVGCAVPAALVWWTLATRTSLSVAVEALVVLPTFAGVYFGVAWLRGAPELALWLGRFSRR
ncbi:MAG: murein biosynthesis integral membrane protein MurJ [Acidobacteriota bacterium]